MPIYEYVCQSCGHAFEELVYGEERVAPAMGCGGCGDPRGPGACRLN